MVSRASVHPIGKREKEIFLRLWAMQHVLEPAERAFLESLVPRSHLSLTEGRNLVKLFQRYDGLGQNGGRKTVEEYRLERDRAHASPTAWDWKAYKHSRKEAKAARRAAFDALPEEEKRRQLDERRRNAELRRSRERQEPSGPDAR